MVKNIFFRLIITFKGADFYNNQKNNSLDAKLIARNELLLMMKNFLLLTRTGRF